MNLTSSYTSVRVSAESIRHGPINPTGKGYSNPTLLRLRGVDVVRLILFAIEQIAPLAGANRVNALLNHTALRLREWISLAKQNQDTSAVESKLVGTGGLVDEDYPDRPAQLIAVSELIRRLVHQITNPLDPLPSSVQALADDIIRQMAISWSWQPGGEINQSAYSDKWAEYAMMADRLRSSNSFTKQEESQQFLPRSPGQDDLMALLDYLSEQGEDLVLDTPKGVQLNLPNGHTIVAKDRNELIQKIVWDESVLTYLEHLYT